MGKHSEEAHERLSINSYVNLADPRDGESVTPRDGVGQTGLDDAYTTVLEGNSGSISEHGRAHYEFTRLS